MTEGRSNAPKLCIIWYVIWWSAFVCCKFYSHPNAWCYDTEIPISGKTNVHFGPWPPLFVILRSILWRAGASVNLKSLRFPSRWSIFFALLPTCEAEHLTMQIIQNIPDQPYIPTSHPTKWNTKSYSNWVASQFTDFSSSRKSNSTQSPHGIGSGLWLHKFP